MDAANPILDVRHLCVRYEGSPKTAALQDVSFCLKTGEAVGLAGRSGSGKTTLANTILRALPDTAIVNGSIRFKGADLLSIPERDLNRIRGANLAMVHQEPALALNPVIRVGDQVGEVLRAHLSFGRRERHDRVRELLVLVGLQNARYLKAYPHELSGGERRRVVLAQALACRPELLIADEPTAGLDGVVRSEIIRLFQALREKYGFTLLLISHDIDLLDRLTERRLQIENGRLAERDQTAYHDRIAVVALAPESGDTVLSVRGLAKSYAARTGSFGREEVPVLRGIDLELKKAETTALIGPSGAGKSTLARCLALLEEPTTGEMQYRQNDVRHLSAEEKRALRPKIQLVFQESAAALSQRFSVERAIAEPLLIRNKQSRNALRTRSMALLEEVGLPHEYLSKSVTELSGGERQRVCIARALACEPEVVIFDESTSGLDEENVSRIIALLHRLQRTRGLTYLFISHDLKLVRSFAHKVLVMQEGRVHEQIAQVDDTENEVREMAPVAGKSVSAQGASLR